MTYDDKLDFLVLARSALRDALIFCRKAGAPKTANKIRSAIKSIGGARRHVIHLECRDRMTVKKGAPCQG
jgi:hypothetical protein